VFVAVVAVGLMLEMRKPQVEEIVKSAPLPPPAAVPLTSKTITEPTANLDHKTRPSDRTMERVNANVPLREGDIPPKAAGGRAHRSPARAVRAGKAAGCQTPDRRPEYRHLLVNR
jgi:hypothetical protein